MAALATAAISRVGTQNSGAQAQVTITMTATVRATSAPTAPSTPAQIPSADATTAEAGVGTTLAGRSSSVGHIALAIPAAIATAPVSTGSSPSAVPKVIELMPSVQTPTPTATTKTPTTKSTKTLTPSVPSGGTVDAIGSTSESWWNQRQGRILAACRGDELAYAEPWAATGYQVTTSSTWIRTAFFFDGPSPVTVVVGCHNGHVTFTTSG
jgi:hypothetical protein